MKTIIFNKHKFQISNEGILFWFDKQIAIISDLHLEKGSSFGPSGQFLPPYDSEETLKKLSKGIKSHNIKKVILLGDTFHDKNSLNRMNINTQKKLKSLTNLYEFILIEGNHDKNIIYEIPSHKILRLNDIEFIHEAIVDDRHQISGHFHPVATIKSSIKKITAKCLLHTNNHIILPSFGTYTGGLNINDPALKPFVNHKSYVYMLTKKSIYKFTSKEVEI